MIYLDWNATAPPTDDVVRAMMDAAKEAWGNPASVHAAGRRARARVEDARAAVGALFAADPRDVVLTSGGTEANNLALRSAFADPGERRGLVTSRLEHPSVLRVCESLEKNGLAELIVIKIVPETGQIDLEDLDRSLSTGRIRLVTVQAVNHETGVVQPITEVIRRAQAAGARVHVDAVQAAGKVDALAHGADTRSVAAHKMRGPKGIGALVTRPGVKLHPVLLGGAQERGLRPGTVDPVAASGFAVAAARAGEGPARYARVAALRDRLEAALARRGAVRNATGPRAPHVASLAFPGWSGPELVAALDLEGVCVSSGSACSAGTAEPSPVLTAMVGSDQAARSVRVSLGETTTDEEIDAAIAAFERVLARQPRGAV